MNRLPQEWYIKVNPEVRKIVPEYLNKTFKAGFRGDALEKYAYGVFNYEARCEEISFFENRSILCLTLEEFRNLVEFPEYWCIKADGLDGEVGNYFNTQTGRRCYKFESGYYHRFNEEKKDITKEGHKGASYHESYIRPGYTEITKEEFLEHVLKIEKETIVDKKIIGYKVPFDLFNGEIKAGVMYRPLASVNNMSYVAIINKVGTWYPSKYNLPKEIVEQWEPVYESVCPDITINGYKAEFFEDYVKFGCAEINKSVFITLNKLRQSLNLDSAISYSTHTNRSIESVTIGKGTFTKEQIKEIAEYYTNKE